MIKVAPLLLALAVLTGCARSFGDSNRQYWLVCESDGKSIVESSKTDIRPYLADKEQGVWIFSKSDLDGRRIVDVGSYRQRFGELCTVKEARVENDD